MGGLGLLNQRIYARIQIFNQDASGLVGLMVNLMKSVIPFGNFEGSTCTVNLIIWFVFQYF